MLLLKQDDGYARKEYLEDKNTDDILSISTNCTHREGLRNLEIHMKMECSLVE